MSRKSKELAIEEYPGTLHPSLEAAQAASLPILAPLFVNTFRQMIESGRLEIQDGRVIVAH